MAATAPEEQDLYRDAMLSVSDGRLDHAEVLLKQLTEQEPRHAGAWLDLAMLYCAAGNAIEAEKWFDAVERRFAPPPSILQVIAQQRTLGCKGWQARGELTLRAGRGFESNANQGARNPNFSIGSGINQVDLVLLPEYQPRSDHVSTVSAEWARELSPNGAMGVVQVQARSYDVLRAFNTSSVFAGLEQPWRWGAWGFKGLGSLGVMTLDGRLYLQQQLLQLEALPPLPLPPNWQLGLTASVSAIDYPSLNGFDAQWREVRSTLRYRRDDIYWQASASVVQDLQTGKRPGGDRAGAFADMQARMALSNRVQLELGVQLQRWQGDAVYSPGLIDVRRKQHTQVLRAALTYQINAQQSLVLELKDNRNNENVPIFDYRNRGMLLNWQWQPIKTR